MSSEIELKLTDANNTLLKEVAFLKRELKFSKMLVDSLCRTMEVLQIKMLDMAKEKLIG